MVSRLHIFVLFSLIFVSSTVWAASTEFADIKVLLGKGEAETAYQRLESIQAQYEGLAEYDLLLAQAAILTERANLALFILDRLVISQPNHYPARWLMANAYARLGHTDLARTELSSIVASGAVDPQLKQQAVSMLAALNAAGSRHQLQAFVAMGFGYDTNANASTTNQTFLGFDLSPESVATASMSEMLNLGMSWQYQFSAHSVLLTSLDWRNNIFPQASFVNNELAQYQVGWQNPQHYALMVQASQVSVDGVYSSGGNHILGLWYLGDTNIFLRAGEQGNQIAQNVKDVSQYLVGGKVSLSHWLKNTSLTGLVAEDIAIQPDSPYGRSIYGLNLSTDLQILNPFTVRIRGGVLYSDYRGLFFGLGRQERQSNLSVGLHTKRWKHWDLDLDLAYADIWSTIALYDYERFTMGLTFKRNYQR